MRHLKPTQGSIRQQVRKQKGISPTTPPKNFVASKHKEKKAAAEAAAAAAVTTTDDPSKIFEPLEDAVTDPGIAQTKQLGSSVDVPNIPNVFGPNSAKMLNQRDAVMEAHQSHQQAFQQAIREQEAANAGAVPPDQQSIPASEEPAAKSAAGKPKGDTPPTRFRSKTKEEPRRGSRSGT